MEDLMDTSEFVSDADFLPNTPMPAKPSGKGAPELLSDMSGAVHIISYILSFTKLQLGSLSCYNSKTSKPSLQLHCIKTLS